jgi:hypothetical protein
MKANKNKRSPASASQRRKLGTEHVENANRIKRKPIDLCIETGTVGLCSKKITIFEANKIRLA